MTLMFRGASKQMVILKGGNSYDVNNFGIFFNSIQRVYVKIERNRTGTFEVTAAPSLSDALEILKSGALTIMTNTAAKRESTTKTKNSTTISESFASKDLKVSSSSGIPSIYSTNMPTFLIKLLWPGDTLKNGNEAETPWFTGFAQTPDVSFDAKSFVFTVKGNVISDLVSGVYGTNVFQEQTIADIIKGIDGTLKIKTHDDVTEQKINTVKTSFAYNDNTKAAIERLLYEVGIVFYSTGDTLYLMDRATLYTSIPLYQFVAFRQIDPANNVFPILEYDCEGLGRLFTGGLALGVLSKMYDLAKKEAVTKSFSNSLNHDIKTAVEKQEKVAGTPGSPSFVGPLLPSSTTNANNAATDTMNNFLQCTIKTMGIPDIFPGCMVDVRIGDDGFEGGLPGVSGKGMVHTVEHEYSSNSWITTLGVRIGASIGSSEYASIPEFSKTTSESAVAAAVKEKKVNFL